MGRKGEKMKKLFTAVFIAAFMLASAFTIYANDAVRNVYTYHYLGISFTLPDTWVILTEADINELADDALGLGLYAEADLISGEADHFTFAAMCSATGANINLLRGSDPPYDIETMSQDLVVGMSELGYEIVLDDLDTVIIGNYEWYYLSYDLQFGGSTINMHQFGLLRETYYYVLTISIPTWNTIYTVDDIFAFISGIENEINDDFDLDIDNWDGRVFSCENLGLRFTLPVTWRIVDFYEFTANQQATNEYLFYGKEAEYEALIESLDDGRQTLFVMRAECTVNFAVVSVRYVTNIQFTIEDVLSEIKQNYDIMGRSIEISETDNVTIGGEQWYYFYYPVEAFGFRQYVNMYVNIRDDSFYTIIINVGGNYSIPHEQILARFTSLSERAPSVPAPQHPRRLVGTWIWEDDHTFVYDFRADGTAEAGFFPDIHEFEWFVADGNHLIIESDGFIFSFTFTVSRNALVLQSRQFPDEVYRYINIRAPGAPPAIEAGHASELIGRWYWDVDDTYLYQFHDDGSVARGFFPAFYELEWFTVGSNLFMTDGTTIERWIFTIDGDVLTLDNHFFPEMSFNYIRE